MSLDNDERISGAAVHVHRAVALLQVLDFLMNSRGCDGATQQGQVEALGAAALANAAEAQKCLYD